jgi:hypothetical protein
VKSFENWKPYFPKMSYPKEKSPIQALVCSKVEDYATGMPYLQEVMAEMAGELAEAELSQPLLRITSTGNLEAVAMAAVVVVVLALALMIPITLYEADRAALAAAVVVAVSTNRVQPLLKAAILLAEVAVVAAVPQMVIPQPWVDRMQEISVVALEEPALILMGQALAAAAVVAAVASEALFLWILV